MVCACVVVSCYAGLMLSVFIFFSLTLSSCVKLSSFKARGGGAGGSALTHGITSYFFFFFAVGVREGFQENKNLSE